MQPTTNRLHYDISAAPNSLAINGNPDICSNVSRLLHPYFNFLQSASKSTNSKSKSNSSHPSLDSCHVITGLAKSLII